MRIARLLPCDNNVNTKFPGTGQAFLAFLLGLEILRWLHHSPLVNITVLPLS
jgi:hypothetical protein